MRGTPRERFENFSLPVSCGCWIWIGETNRQGYGQFKLEGRTRRANRISYVFYTGPIPGSLLVCHKCDTPGCVNPDHLFLGTQKENIQDCINKGRPRADNRGEKQGNSKLTAAQVMAIRQDTRLLRLIANDHDVGVSMISEIKNGKKWAHLLNNGEVK